METMTRDLVESLQPLLSRRGMSSARAVEAFLSPSLEHLASPDCYPDMPKAVERLRQAIQNEEMIALYADRDVDGLSGLTILARTIRTLGGRVSWGGPLEGRGVERAVVDGLLAQGAKVLIFIDCGTGETAELKRLAEAGFDVMVADHHRLQLDSPPALAWIHPAKGPQEDEHPAGCVMAFKLAQALWLSFLGDDTARLDYFLYSHLDVLALGILADRVPLTGENRVLVWHGLRRLAQTRKTGLAALLRFCRLVPRTGPITVREATWQIIPMLNAAGRLGQLAVAADLLMTEDPWKARACIDQLIALNSERREAQDKSLAQFEKCVADQCSIDDDPVLVALASGLEPSVTGLAAQALARKFGRPAFLFVSDGDQAVGSARGVEDIDLFAWVETHKHLLVKFGGHEGAVGMTVKVEHFETFRRELLGSSRGREKLARNDLTGVEAALRLRDADLTWWTQLQQFEPFGPGNPMPLFELSVERLEAVNRRKVRGLTLWDGAAAWPAEWESADEQTLKAPGPWRVRAFPAAIKNSDFPFKWMIQEVQPHHG